MNMAQNFGILFRAREIQEIQSQRIQSQRIQSQRIQSQRFSSEPEKSKKVKPNPTSTRNTFWIKQK